MHMRSMRISATLVAVVLFGCEITNIDDVDFARTAQTEAVGTLTFTGNISDAGPPNFMDGIRDVHVSGDYAYVVSVWDDAFNVVDVSDPSSPTLAASVRGFHAPHFLSRPASVDIVGDFAYVLSSRANVSQSGITIFDISSPTHPVVVGHFFHELFGNANTVKVHADHAYVVQGPNSWISVVDVTDPSNPVFSSLLSLGPGVFPFDIDISGDHAFVPGANNATLYVINISDPLSLDVVATLSGAGFPNFLGGAAGVRVSGSNAFVTAISENSLTVIDVSNPKQPSFLSKVSDDGLGGARHLHISLNHAFIAAGADIALTVVDIVNPHDPTVIASVQGAGAPNFLRVPLDVHVSGIHAYVAAFGNSETPIGDNSLSIFDISQLRTSPIQHLSDLVETFVTAGIVNTGQANALAAKLAAAIQKLTQGNVNATMNQLQAFINQVNGLIGAGVLSNADGAILIDAAEAIITALNP